MLQRAPIAICDAARRHELRKVPHPRAEPRVGNALIVCDAGDAQALGADVVEQISDGVATNAECLGSRTKQVVEARRPPASGASATAFLDDELEIRCPMAAVFSSMG